MCGSTYLDFKLILTQTSNIHPLTLALALIHSRPRPRPSFQVRDYLVRMLNKLFAIEKEKPSLRHGPIAIASEAEAEAVKLAAITASSDEKINALIAAKIPTHSRWETYQELKDKVANEGDIVPHHPERTWRSKLPQLAYASFQPFLLIRFLIPTPLAGRHTGDGLLGMPHKPGERRVAMWRLLEKPNDGGSSSDSVISIRHCAE